MRRGSQSVAETFIEAKTQRWEEGEGEKERVNTYPIRAGDLPVQTRVRLDDGTHLQTSSLVKGGSVLPSLGVPEFDDDLLVSLVESVTAGLAGTGGMVVEVEAVDNPLDLVQVLLQCLVSLWEVLLEVEVGLE